VVYHARWTYRIYSFKEKPLEAILVSPDVFRYPLRLSERIRLPAAKPGFTIARPGEKSAEESGGPGRANVPPERRMAEGDKGTAAGPAPGAGGLSSEFKLTFPADAKIVLSKPASKVEDTLVSPGRYRTRTDIDFSKYLENETTAGNRNLSSPRGGGTAQQKARRRTGGGSVSMSVPKIDFSPWAGAVLNKIQRNWVLPAEAGTDWKAEVGVAVLVAKSGELLAVEIDAPSKIEILDGAATRAINASGPFPALPAAFPDSSLEVYFVFQYGHD